MKTAAVIAEYNPFHIGHRYHIKKTRELADADYVIAVMSGDFVQRGEPACTDKYFRTRMALAGGADLVIELPAVYAAGSAERFAAAGVLLLDSLRCVDYLSFGSEWASLSDYEPYVELFSKENSRFKCLLQRFLRQGDSFPAARSRAAEIVLKEQAPGSMQRNSEGDFLKEPNHILGLEYLKALRRLGSEIRPVAVPRQGAGYNETELPGCIPNKHMFIEPIPSGSAKQDGNETWHPTDFVRYKHAFIEEEEENGCAKKDLSDAVSSDSYPSAAAIRKACAQWMSARDQKRKAGDSQNGFRLYDPEDSLYRRIVKSLGEGGESFLEHISAGEYVVWNDLMPLLDYEMLMRSYEGASGSPEDDLMRRIRKNYRPGCSVEEIIRLLHARNRTDSAVRRALLHILLRTDYDLIPCISYARVLGFRKTAAPLMKEIREKSEIPLIQRAVEGFSLFSEGSLERRIYEADLKAADLYEQIAAGKAGRRAVKELRKKQVVMQEPITSV